jgi:hypothetical protein
LYAQCRYVQSAAIDLFDDQLALESCNVTLSSQAVRRGWRSPMGCVRASTRFGVCLALIALALQFVLPFGHVHLEGIQRAVPTVHAAGYDAHAFVPGSAQLPGEDDNGYCAICATIYLAANSFLPQAPQLTLPFVSLSIEHFHQIVLAALLPRRMPFQSRAPPLA